jgi:Tht1-like nuclear fusion protein
VELLKTLNDKPACHKAATHQLITSCQSIREDAMNPRPSVENLETTKSIFAARLAICELRDASARTPPQCAPIMTVSARIDMKISQNLSKSTTYAAEQISSGDLRACLKALESKPQSWTSYSNSRQYASMICDASRVDILKDEALELFRLLTNIGYDMSHALADALQRAISQQKAEMAFAKALKDLRTEQLQDLAKAHQENKAVMEESSDQLSKAASHVSDTIRSASGSASDLKQIVEAIFRSAATGGAELAYLRFRDAEASHKVVMALHNMVQEVTNNDVAILRESLSEAASIVVGIFVA